MKIKLSLLIFLTVILTKAGVSQVTVFPKEGTINAYDKASKEIIDPINIWEKKEPSEGRIVAKAHHNDKVIILKREKNKVYVETKGKVRGWITYWFIKEFQAEANKDPLLN